MSSELNNFLELINSKFDSLQSNLNERLDKVEKRITEMDENSKSINMKLGIIYEMSLRSTLKSSDRYFDSFLIEAGPGLLEFISVE